MKEKYFNLLQSDLKSLVVSESARSLFIDFFMLVQDVSRLQAVDLGEGVVRLEYNSFQGVVTLYWNSLINFIGVSYHEVNPLVMHLDNTQEYSVVDNIKKIVVLRTKSYLIAMGERNTLIEYYVGVYSELLRSSSNVREFIEKNNLVEIRKV
jgi:hypothetical protein